MFCNCGPLLWNTYERVHSPPCSNINIYCINYTTTRTAPRPWFSITIPIPPPFSFSTVLANPEEEVPYPKNANGLPVNDRDGVIVTESRSIFISNLDHSTSYDELNKLAQTSGNPIALHLLTRKSKVTGATITFATEREALLSIEVLNEKELRGRKIRVRPDKNSTVILK